MSYCINCGKEIYSGKNICPECRAKRESAEPQKPVAEKKDYITAVIIFVLTVLASNFLVYAGAGLGLAVCSAAIFTVTVVYYGRKAKFTAYGIILCVLQALLSAGLFLCDEEALQFLTVAALIGNLCLIATDALDLRRFADGVWQSAGDLVANFFANTLGGITEAIPALFRKKDKEGRTVSRSGKYVILGIAISIPVLLIVVPQLVRADAAFEALLKIIGTNMAEVAVTLVLGAAAFTLVFSFLYRSSKTEVRKSVWEYDENVNNVITVSFLSAISFVYVLYLLSQGAYFFSGFLGILPEDLYVANYAKRGFYEMCGVVAVNLIVVAVSLIVTKKNEGKTPVPVKILSTFVCLFSLLMTAIAMSKMALYVKSFGMTKSRVYSSVFTVLTAVSIITVLIRIYAPKFKYMKVIAVTGLALLALMTCGNVNKFIADYNVDAYIDGRLPDADVNELINMNSYSVAPALERLYKAGGDAAEDAARGLLHVKSDWEIDHGDENRIDFRGVTLPELIAEKVLDRTFY